MAIDEHVATMMAFACRVNDDARGIQFLGGRICQGDEGRTSIAKL